MTTDVWIHINIGARIARIIDKVDLLKKLLIQFIKVLALSHHGLSDNAVSLL